MTNRIALLGWGSLLWDRRREFDDCHAPWRHDGPTLPIEFSRVSSSRSGALTLVIDPDNGVPVTVAWSLSRRRRIDQAIEDVRKRECTSERNIGWLSGNEARSCDAAALAAIRAWAEERDVQGVVWTDLRGNFAEKTGERFSVESAIRYLMSLKGEARAKAFQYIRCAPPFVRTPLRDAFDRKIGSLTAQER